MGSRWQFSLGAMLGAITVGCAALGSWRLITDAGGDPKLVFLLVALAVGIVWMAIAKSQTL